MVSWSVGRSVGQFRRMHYVQHRACYQGSPCLMPHAAVPQASCHSASGLVPQCLKPHATVHSALSRVTASKCLSLHASPVAPQPSATSPLHVYKAAPLAPLPPPWPPVPHRVSPPPTCARAVSDACRSCRALSSFAMRSLASCRHTNMHRQAVAVRHVHESRGRES